jgi:hypothetical protein
MFLGVLFVSDEPEYAGYFSEEEHYLRQVFAVELMLAAAV